MKRPKFIADADFNLKISEGVRLREPTVDFLSASDGGTRGLPDRRVLELVPQPVESSSPMIATR